MMKIIEDLVQSLQGIGVKSVSTFESGYGARNLRPTYSDSDLKQKSFKEAYEFFMLHPRVFSNAWAKAASVVLIFGLLNKENKREQHLGNIIDLLCCFYDVKVKMYLLSELSKILNQQEMNNLLANARELKRVKVTALHNDTYSVGTFGRV